MPINRDDITGVIFCDFAFRLLKIIMNVINKREKVRKILGSSCNKNNEH
ncbi:hypothetical protein C7421_103140 [Pantoea ananatis]|nr:hypothetical protein C7421_103140 [Pantoea ananatis]